MRTYFVLALAMLGLGICQGQAGPRDRAQLVPVSPKDSAVRRHTPKLKEVPAEEKAKIPAAYLSIGEFYARRDPNAVPPRIRVAGFYHNYTRQMVSGATFSIDRWNGTGWTTLKSGPLGPIAANKPGAESLDLASSNDAMKFRFVVSKSVEGSKECQLSGGQVTQGVRSNSNLKDRVVSASATARVKPFPQAIETSPIVKAKVSVPYLSIDQIYAGRDSTKILVRGYLSNPNLRPVPSATYSFARGDGSSWSTIKSGNLESIQPAKSAYVFAELPLSFDAMKFRLRVIPSVEGTREVALPQKAFVVKYRCPDWQVYADFEQNSNYLGTSKRDRELKDLGFEVRIKDTYHDSVFSSYHSITLSYRSVNLQERSFPTPTAARGFQASLPTQGVATNIEER